MTQTDIGRALHRHNWLQLGIGLSLIPMAIGAWYVSYWILYTIFRFALEAVDGLGIVEVQNARQVAHFIALGGLALLALLGTRHSGELFGLTEYGESIWARNPLAESHAGRVATAAIVGHPAGAGYCLSQVLLCAPQATVLIPKVFRSVLRADPEAIAQAAEVRDELADGRKWLPLNEFRDRAAGVTVLIQLKLVWTRIENGRAEVRILPGES